MVNMNDFYDELDLKYTEIGIAIQDIYKENPGNVKIIIPILTPSMRTDAPVETLIRQTKSSNLLNSKKNKTVLEIANVLCTNYMEIPFPPEVCAASKANDEGYIPSGSKWIMVFVGGDITKPRPIARYLD